MTFTNLVGKNVEVVHQFISMDYACKVEKTFSGEVTDIENNIITLDSGIEIDLSNRNRIDYYNEEDCYPQLVASSQDNVFTTRIIIL